MHSRLIPCALLAAAAFACDDPTPPLTLPPDAGVIACQPTTCPPPEAETDPALISATRMVKEGRDTFRNDTFGDEAFWGDTIKLHTAIEGEANGGVGPGLTPNQALALGLKVDAEKIPESLAMQIKAGQVNLDDPATTLALLQLNAVVGITGIFDATPNAAGLRLKSVGIQCALCHSTVDDSFAPGIGIRRDGWPNRDLNVGAIVNLAPDLTAVDQLLGVDDATLRTVLMSWGPGKFDAEVFLDGKAFQPNGMSAATLIPAAFGLAGVNLHTYTGWGSVTYWNAFVANLEMHGKGTFTDERLDDAAQFPIAARNNFGHTTVELGTDRITPKLGALHFYQLALEAPQPAAGSFDPAAADRGKALFNGTAKCATCHVPPLFTDPGWNMHEGEDIGIDTFQASRAPDKEYYRTTPLKGLWARTKGGFYHDGRFATLQDVIAHYQEPLQITLTSTETNDLAQYLMSL